MAGRGKKAARGNGRKGSSAGKPERRGDGRAPRGLWRRLFGFLGYWVMVAGVWGLIALIGLVAYYAYDLPSVDELNRIDRRNAVTFFSRNGERLVSYGDLYGEAVQLADLPPHLPAAVLATEDRRFYEHFGLDPFGVARALWINLRRGHVVQGGSTITQQLAKIAFLTSERTLKRKVQEALLALWLEANFSKEQILTLYLNRVYLGSGAYGVDAAARKYFAKPATDVSLPEAAMLAGLLKAPSYYAPTRSLKRAHRRAAVVLTAMQDAGVLDAATARNALEQPARLRRSRVSGLSIRYFADWLLDRLPDYVGRTDRDLTVITTLDARLQALGERAVAEGLKREGRSRQVSQAALVAMSPSGAVRAMVGGRNYGASQYNRVTQARRQPGSAFKPAVYLAGLESGLSADTVFVDKPIRVGKWRPRNHDGRFRGPVSLRHALARSINTVAVQVADRAGVDRVRDAALRLGITSEIARDLSIALGSSGVSLLELTSAYATLSAGGEAAHPHGIVEIRDGDGRVLYRRQGQAVRTVRPADAAHLTGMLSAVLGDKGTGKAARIDRPAAGKTGTSQDYRDAWFVGYTPDLVAGVWFGNDNNAPMKRVTGGGLPARQWAAFMRPAHRGLAKRAFAGPRAATRQAASEASGEGVVQFWQRLFKDIVESAPASGGGAGETRGGATDPTDGYGNSENASRGP